MKAVLKILLLCSILPGILFAEESEEPVLSVQLIINKSRLSANDVLFLKTTYQNKSNRGIRIYLRDIYTAAMFEVKEKYGQKLTWRRKVIYDEPFNRGKLLYMPPKYEHNITYKASVYESNGIFYLDFADSYIRLGKAGEYKINNLYSPWQGFDSYSIQNENIYLQSTKSNTFSVRLEVKGVNDY